MKYDPENWLESALNVIRDYALEGFHEAVADDNGNWAGEDVYNIVMEFPGPALDRSEIPLQRTVVHFEVDDIVDSNIGFGMNEFALNYDPVTKSVNPQYARSHLVNFDVGVWASALSGGITSRIRAKQILESLFGDPSGQVGLRDFSDADDGVVELISYTGGRFIIDQINDSPVYRMIDGALVVRVFSRTKLSDTPGPAIEEIVQDPNLEIIGPPTGDLIILG